MIEINKPLRHIVAALGLVLAAASAAHAGALTRWTSSPTAWA